MAIVVYRKKNVLKLATFGWLFLVSFSLSAALVKNEVTSLRSKSFPLTEVCLKMNGKHAELISAHSMNEVDCMGKVTSAVQFCLKESGSDSDFVRAEVMAKTKNVLCYSGDSVSFSLSCEGTHKKFCLNARTSCEEIKQKYAYSLELAHQSIIEKTLNCHFIKMAVTPLEAL